MPRFLCAVLAACAIISPTAADTIMLPMRDGVKLHTEFDLPLFYKPGSRIAAVLERSPYGANAEELIADLFGETLGYVSVRQDMRGTKQSEGSFGIWHDSQPDAYDTMEWITNQTWSNGVVFTSGASADAIDELAQVSGPHPALRGQVSIFASADGWGTFYPGGAYREALIDGWLKGTVPTQYEACDALVRASEQPDTPWWSTVNGSMFFKNTAWPTMHWAGWCVIFPSTRRNLLLTSLRTRLPRHAPSHAPMPPPSHLLRITPIRLFTGTISSRKATCTPGRACSTMPRPPHAALRSSSSIRAATARRRRPSFHTTRSLAVCSCRFSCPST